MPPLGLLIKYYLNTYKKHTFANNMNCQIESLQGESHDTTYNEDIHVSELFSWEQWFHTSLQATAKPRKPCYFLC